MSNTVIIGRKRRTIVVGSRRTVLVAPASKKKILIFPRSLPGATGSQGPQGPIGNTGPQGEQGNPGAPGIGVPSGGDAGQILAKIDGTNYNTEWIDAPTGGDSTRVLIPFKNQSGATIKKGALVQFDGTLGNSGIIKAKPYTPGAPGHLLMGFATADVAKGGDGFTMDFGEIEQLDTTGAGVSETWADGDLLYPHPTQVGKVTKVQPTAPSLKMEIAAVVHAHPNGSIQVRMTPGHTIASANDATVTSPTAGQALVYDSGVWKNKSVFVYIYDGWIFSEEDEEFICLLPDMTPGENGPFLAYNSNGNCQNWFQWDIIAQQWRPYVLYYGQAPTGDPNKMAAYNSAGNLGSYGNARVIGSQFAFDNRVYFSVPDPVRTSGRSPYNSSGPFFARHQNGFQYTDLRLAYGSFDMFREDINPGGSFITTAVTFRNTNTEGDYRPPVVGDEIYVQRARITRRNTAPYDPYSDASSFDFITIYVQSVNPTTKDVGTRVQLRTRKNTDPVWTNGGGNLALEVDENLNLKLPGYPDARDDASAPANILSTTADGTVNSHPVKDLFAAVPQLTDATAVNNSIYYSTTQNKLCYKDPGGTINPLY